MKYFLVTLSLFLSFYLPQSTANTSVTAPPTQLKSIDELVEQGKLSISQQIQQSEQQIVGQALVVSIKVATDRWFAMGSQLQNFSLKNVVMQANNIETFNGSERINGSTWATQTHEVTLYPTSDGTYQLPVIDINVSINTEHDGIISGVISTQAESFDILLPDELQGIEHFIVSPDVTLNVEGVFDEDKGYAIGEAVTQTITITATNIPAMMIPEVNGQTLAVDGISVYHKPAQIFDKSNRGTSTATRVESFTYIFEKSGSYTIDEKIIFWWNSKNDELQRLIIPSSSWSVSGEGVIKSSQQGFIDFITISKQSGIIIILSALVLCLSYVGFIKRHVLVCFYKKVSKQEQRILRKQFLKAVVNNSYLKATQHLYQYALVRNGQASIQNNTHLYTLNELAFAATAESTNVKFSVDDAKSLIKLINADNQHKQTRLIFKPNSRIKLND